jgi:hypothetical protein
MAEHCAKTTSSAALMPWFGFRLGLLSVVEQELRVPNVARSSMRSWMRAGSIRLMRSLISPSRSPSESHRLHP